ncbi:MAG: hypothetical protein Q8O56_05200 [Solirubrobacteraceae bacterium]|nr:hypothetical protein [Solirubrobacteraceae bacterium]
MTCTPMTCTPPRLAGLAALGAAALLAGPAAPADAARMHGTFQIEPGRVTASGVSGSHFRLRFPGGRAFFRNSDSPARDKTYTLIRPGTAGGLVSDRYQRPAGRPFDRDGNSRAAAIIRPIPFAGIRFGLMTLAVDPQSRRRNSVPAIVRSGQRLRGHLAGVTAGWNGTYFNQGTPKPGASGLRAIGSYDPRTRRFVLRWSSRVQGGAFNNFVGFWTLTGRFVPR